jgi:hypothetical protein
MISLQGLANMARMDAQMAKLLQAAAVQGRIQAQADRVSISSQAMVLFTASAQD